ncbi:MAG: MSMEG_0565 family glycosyltransferase [Anaerolineae bacterium]
MPSPLYIALYTYSTKPRGGVVHTLQLAEALQRAGQEVHVYALGKDEPPSFFRPTTVPYTLIPFVKDPDETIETRVARFIDTYYRFLTEHDLSSHDIHHAQDCISANALWRLREAGRLGFFVRTVHHIDDFVSPALIECQNNSVLRPDYRIVVSAYWQARLRAEFGVRAQVIHNGVDTGRFRLPAEPDDQAALKAEFDLDGRRVFLTIGGIEPRKNTLGILEAFARARTNLLARGEDAALVIAGGETLFDYSPYRAEFFAALERERLSLEREVRFLGPVADEVVTRLYHLADCLAFPSLREGWGLVVLEALASGLPVIASDISVFREYLRHGENALLVPPESAERIAAAMIEVTDDEELAARLRHAGRQTALAFSWDRTAQRHIEIYQELLRER